jgi:hypothetical protein
MIGRALLIAACLASGVVGSLGAEAWSDIAINHRQDCMTKPPLTRWTLCGLFMVLQAEGSPTGGPQALEGYVEMTHLSPGSVDLAIGTIGNVEHAGSGAVRRIEALRGGVMISGPGRVQEAAALSLYQATRKGGYAGPVNVDRSIYIQFDNGWSMRPDGEALLLCDPHGRCRSF